MKNFIHINKVLVFAVVLFGTITLTAQAEANLKSTEDLSFLIGEWEIVRTYSPKQENERVLKGTLVCQTTMDDKFIKCTYEMARPGKIRGLDEVYFNYNPIYEVYESMWLSSTWPIKVLMKGMLSNRENNTFLNTSAEFSIGNNVTEYVKGELVIGLRKPDQDSFTRQTYIRTSNQQEEDWHHHMIEIATRK